MGFLGHECYPREDCVNEWERINEWVSPRRAPIRLFVRYSLTILSSISFGGNCVNE